MVEVFLGFRRNDAGEAQEGDEVRDGHEAVDDISQRPDGFELEEDGRGQDGDVADTVELDGLCAEEVFPAPLAVVVPADNGGEGEEGEGNGEDEGGEAP